MVAASVVVPSHKYLKYQQKNGSLVEIIYSGFVPFFRNKFPGLFQDSDCFFKGSKIHINLYNPKISMSILLTAFHTVHIFSCISHISRTFQDQWPFSRTFQDFPVLENAIMKFQDFPGFPGPVRTLSIGRSSDSFTGNIIIQHHLANLLFSLYSSFICPFVRYCFMSTVSSAPGNNHIFFINMDQKRTHENEVCYSTSTMKSPHCSFLALF